MQQDAPSLLLVDPEDLEELVQQIVDGGHSRAETFFIGQDLGAAFALPGRGWGIRKRVNEALIAAERQGVRDNVLQAAIERYGLDMAVVPKSLAAKPQSLGRLFVSHASADKHLADKLTSDLLRLGTGLSHERILCTSLEGMKIPDGTGDYMGFLREQLSGAALVLPIITPAFLESDVCLVELGAMWGGSIPAFPLIVPPVTYGRIESIVGNLQCSKVNEKGGLSRLYDRICEVFDLAPTTDMWEKHRDDFLRGLPKQLRKLTPTTRVPVEQHDRVLEELEKAADEIDQLRTENASLSEKLEAVAQLKDSDEVNEIMVDGDLQADYVATLKSAQMAVFGLPTVVRKALYENVGRTAPYAPDPYDFEDAEVADRNGQLALDEDQGGYWVVREDHEVDEAARAIELFFDGSWGDEIEELFRSQHGMPLASKNKKVWAALGLL